MVLQANQFWGKLIAIYVIIILMTSYENHQHVLPNSLNQKCFALDKHLLLDAEKHSYYHLL